MSAPTRAQRHAWMQQWRGAAVALERVRATEMHDVDLARVACDLEDACVAAARGRVTRMTSGLVEQQRVFNLLRR